MDKFKQIYRKIKEYNTIVIARHIGPDPDALGSQFGLKEAILATFPKKKVYAIGAPATRHKYIGQLDKLTEEMYKNSLLIVLDTPNLSRIDGVDVSKFKYKIKIDHHPFIEKFADIELIDDTACSASQIVAELIINTKLELNKEAAEKLFIGIVGDTNRFMHSYTSSKTFEIVGYMLRETNFDFYKLYEPMYLRKLDDLKFQSLVTTNLTLTEDGFGYIKLSQEVLDKYGVDAATATNIVNELTYIDGMYAWAIFAYDKANENIRGSIRSRGPIINKIAEKYNGGGHAFASGVRLSNFNESNDLIKELNEACRAYKQER